MTQAAQITPPVHLRLGVDAQRAGGDAGHLRQHVVAGAKTAERRDVVLADHR